MLKYALKYRLLYSDEHYKQFKKENVSWNGSKLWRPAICVKVQKRAAAASVRPLASLPARPAAAWPTRNVKIQRNKKKRRQQGGAFYVSGGLK